MTRPVRMTLSQAAARTRRPAEEIELALRTGDLPSLTRRDVDAWRRGIIAMTTARARTGAR